MRKYLDVMLGLAALGMGMPSARTPENVRVVNDAPVQAIIDEYKLIQEKKSNLSRRQREAVEHRYKYLIARGIVTP